MTNLNGFGIANHYRRMRAARWRTEAWPYVNQALAAVPGTSRHRAAAVLAFRATTDELERHCYQAWLWHNRLLTDTRDQCEDDENLCPFPGGIYPGLDT